MDEQLLDLQDAITKGNRNDAVMTTISMNNRARFLATMHYQPRDRAPITDFWFLGRDHSALASTGVAQNRSISGITSQTT